MNNPVTKGKGKTAQFLWDNTAYSGDDCLIWPFNRLPNGYGTFGYLGRCLYAHRFMCVLAHGEAPSPDHQATHSCGKGHEGCVNPRHLEWKTNGDNQLDRRSHGTANKAFWGIKGKLTPQEVLEIKDLKDHKTQREIAALYGITFQNVSSIHRGKSQAPRPPNERERVISAMKTIGKPVTAADIKEPAELVTMNSARIMLGKLEKIGAVQRVKRGQYALPNDSGS